jgi:hypothetical protein
MREDGDVILAVVPVSAEYRPFLVETQLYLIYAFFTSLGCLTVTQFARYCTLKVGRAWCSRTMNVPLPSLEPKT